MCIRDSHDCANEFVGVAITQGKVELISRSSSLNALHSLSVLPKEEEGFFTPRTSMHQRTASQDRCELARSHYELSCTLAEREDMEGAFTELQEAIRLTPNYSSWAAITGSNTLL
eukprot:TRINITY_DN27111_c0_g1_i1.p1 TRINITY_DN27111_c0_g1~~TRINITY_DN27111_c0_g1_i1.p1  ORF type:complete len:115 (-),score=24.31 TRINITY_DN27111_c0_g1_i1:279-623(-)